MRKENLRSDESESWDQYKEEQKARRSKRMPERIDEIKSAILTDARIKSLETFTDYQYRINGEIDIYPLHNRFHILKTGKRGSYTPGKLLQFLIKNLTIKTP